MAMLNTYIGFRAGYKNQSGADNTFIGYYAGYDNKQNRNTFIGAHAGEVNTGDNNIFIGRDVGASTADINLSNTFKLGNEATPEWLSGEMTSTGVLSINGTPVVTSSSRALKKNIRILTSTELRPSLEAIVRTPLFTYQYKNKADLPNKTRMGVIAEELPDHLQIRVEGRLPRPDWPSIYGTLWAAIQVLYRDLIQLKETLLTKIEDLKNGVWFLFQRNRSVVKKSLFIRGRV